MIYGKQMAIAASILLTTLLSSAEPTDKYDYLDVFVGNNFGKIVKGVPVDNSRKDVLGVDIEDAKKEDLARVRELYPKLSYLKLMWTDPDQWGGHFYSELAKFRDLQFLVLALTGTNNIPDEVGELNKLPELISLFISQARARKRSPISEQLYNLTSLKELWLWRNPPSLPHGISKMKGLRNMRLLYMPLSALPDDFKDLKLTCLAMNANPSKTDPLSLPLPRTLELLNLSDNHLTFIPPEILGLRSLQILDLSGNRLTEVPSDWRPMKELQKLILYGNNISNVPTFLTHKETFKAIDLEHNPIIHSDPNPEGLVRTTPKRP